MPLLSDWIVDRIEIANCILVVVSRFNFVAVSTCCRFCVIIRFCERCVRVLEFGVVSRNTSCPVQVMNRSSTHLFLNLNLFVILPSTVYVVLQIYSTVLTHLSAIILNLSHHNFLKHL